MKYSADLVNLPESVVCEMHLNWIKYFLQGSNELQGKKWINLTTSLIMSNCLFQGCGKKISSVLC